MPNLTDKYKLKKPLPTEEYNIEDFNGNADTIDKALSGHDQQLADQKKQHEDDVQSLKSKDNKIQDELNKHTGSQDNPHKVTKAQVSLGNVPNVATNDQTPTYSEAGSLTKLESGEKLSTAFGKIAKAITDLITHIGNKENPHGVTKSQVSLGNVPNVTTNNQTPTYTEAGTLAKLSSGETLALAFGKISKAVTDLISHIGNVSNPHKVTKAQVSLGNVDNTSDANKPISTATKTELDKKIDTAGTGLTKSGTTLTHASYGSSGTYGPSANASGGGASFKVPQITTNAQGHISAVAERTMTMPDFSGDLEGRMVNFYTHVVMNDVTGDAHYFKILEVNTPVENSDISGVILFRQTYSTTNEHPRSGLIEFHARFDATMSPINVGYRTEIHYMLLDNDIYDSRSIQDDDIFMDVSNGKLTIYCNIRRQYTSMNFRLISASSRTYDISNTTTTNAHNVYNRIWMSNNSSSAYVTSVEIPEDGKRLYPLLKGMVKEAANLKVYTVNDWSSFNPSVLNLEIGEEKAVFSPSTSIDVPREVGYVGSVRRVATQNYVATMYTYTVSATNNNKSAFSYYTKTWRNDSWSDWGLYNYKYYNTTRRTTDLVGTERELLNLSTIGDTSLWGIAQASAVSLGLPAAYNYTVISTRLGGSTYGAVIDIAYPSVSAASGQTANICYRFSTGETTGTMGAWNTIPNVNGFVRGINAAYTVPAAGSWDDFDPAPIFSDKTIGGNKVVAVSVVAGASGMPNSSSSYSGIVIHIGATSQYFALMFRASTQDIHSNLNMNGAWQGWKHNPKCSATDAAPLSHTHAAADISSGTLPLARGGTGGTTQATAFTNIVGPGGSVTGSITFQGTDTAAGSGAVGHLRFNTGSNTWVPLRVIDHDSSGAALLLNAGGMTVIGSGESSQSLYNYLIANESLNPGSEQMYIASDNSIHFVVGAQAGMGSETRASLSYSGHFVPGDSSSQQLGTTALPWKAVYATSFMGNASTATKLATARTIAVSGGATGTATSFDGSGNITIPVTGLNMENATAGTLSIARGGTGATSASAALTSLGAAPTSHASTATTYGVSSASNYGHAMASATTPKASGTAALGSETAKFARGDHVHPLQTTVTGNAGTATTLATSRAIDGVNFNGSTTILHYGTCTTAAATAAKVVSLSNYVLALGSKIIVTFGATNTAANPTLNVNSTGAKAIQYRGSAITAGYLAANRTYEFVYDGTNYQLVGDINVDTTYTHPSSGVTAGTYRSVTVNAQGHVTGGTNPTVTIAQGGTGATSASAALTALGAAAAGNLTTHINDTDLHMRSTQTYTGDSNSVRVLTASQLEMSTTETALFFVTASVTLERYGTVPAAAIICVNFSDNWALNVANEGIDCKIVTGASAQSLRLSISSDIATVLSWTINIKRIM